MCAYECMTELKNLATMATAFAPACSVKGPINTLSENKETWLPGVLPFDGNQASKLVVWRKKPSFFLRRLLKYHNRVSKGVTEKVVEHVVQDSLFPLFSRFVNRFLKTACLLPKGLIRCVLPNSIVVWVKVCTMDWPIYQNGEKLIDFFEKLSIFKYVFVLT